MPASSGPNRPRKTSGCTSPKTIENGSRTIGRSSRVKTVPVSVTSFSITGFKSFHVGFPEVLATGANAVDASADASHRHVRLCRSEVLALRAPPRANAGAEGPDGSHRHVRRSCFGGPRAARDRRGERGWHVAANGSIGGAFPQAAAGQGQEDVVERWALDFGGLYGDAGLVECPQQGGQH